MNVKELREILEDMPDGAPVVITGPDHSYFDIRTAVLVKAEVTDNSSRPFLEYYNRSSMVDPDAPVIPVCFIM